MAAGLQSFQSNDKQMQAIRELTNEVFNLKQKQVTDMVAIETAIQNAYNEPKYVIGTITYTLAEAYTISGQGSHEFIINAAKQGYKIIGCSLGTYVYQGTLRTGLATTLSRFNAESNNIGFYAVNLTTSDITLNTITGNVFYEKIDE